MEINKSNLRIIIHSKVSNLPTLPTVALKLLELTADDEAAIKEMVLVISNDQAIYSRILKVANSAYYGFARQVTTLDHAINLLGIEMIRSLAVSMKIIDQFKHLGNHKGFTMSDFWLHSIAVGGIARDLGENAPHWNQGPIFTAGLLHDIGKLLLLDLMGDKYFELLSQAEREHIACSFLEKELLGMDHAEVGSFLLERWKLPIEIVDMVNNHHQLSDELKPSPGLLIILADYVAREANLGMKGNNGPIQIITNCQRMLNIDDTVWTAFLDKYLGERGQEVKTLMSAIAG